MACLALNERLLPKEQRPETVLELLHDCAIPSMKGCSRKSSDCCPGPEPYSAASALNERLLPKEQRHWRAARGCAADLRALNERLLPKEQRRGVGVFQGDGGRPSMKGCSRKSSDTLNSLRQHIHMHPSMKGCSRKSSDMMATTDAPMNGALNERLLPKEQRPRADLPKSSATLGPSMKGCSRKSSDLDIHSSYHHSVRRPSMKGCSRKSSDATVATAKAPFIAPSMKGCSRKSSDLVGCGKVEIFCYFPSMKGCSRKSSDLTLSQQTIRESSLTLNERLLPKEQRRPGFPLAALYDAPLNERLLPKEQRPPPCIHSTGLCIPLNERLLPKEQRLPASLNPRRRFFPSMKGCSRKSSDVGE